MLLARSLDPFAMAVCGAKPIAEWLIRLTIRNEVLEITPNLVVEHLFPGLDI